MTEDSLKARLQGILDEISYVRSLGWTVAEVATSEGQIELFMPFSPNICNGAGSGIVHGGAIATLIDTAASMALGAILNAPAATVSLRIDFLRPVVASDVRARAIIRRQGKTISMVDVDLVDAEDRLCATGRGTFSHAAK